MPRFIVESPGSSEGVRAATCKVFYEDDTGLKHVLFPTLAGNRAYNEAWFGALNDRLSGDHGIDLRQEPMDVFTDVVKAVGPDLLRSVEQNHPNWRYKY